MTDHGIGSVGQSIPFTEDVLQRSLPDRFEQIAAELPNQVALKSDETVVTYAQLNATANRLARAILAQTSTQSEAVAILVTRGTQPAAAMLAVLKSGKYLVPIDPSFPESRIAEIIDDAGAKLVISDRQNVTLAREASRGRSRLIELELVDVDAPDDNLRLPIGASAMACIVYTSGSTGQPKGVILDHRALLHNAMLHGIIATVHVDDRVTLLTAGTANAISTTVFSLLAGATLFPFDVAKEGVSRMADWLSRERISIALIAAPLFRRFCASLRNDAHFPDVRLLRLTSDRVYKSDLDLYKRHFSAGCAFVNSLNATETGLICQYRMNHHTARVEADVPVGHALPGKNVFVVDDAGQQAAPHTPGEIVVRSRYLSRGYWRNPEFTASRFKPDPAGGDEVVYHTGDVGVMLPDGRLVHKGRKDFRVKIRGYGVDLVEVQQQLLLHPDIDDAVVVPLKNHNGELSVVAYFTSPIQPPPDVRTLRHFLNSRLAPYMLPSHYIPLQALPLTPNGKINRAALPVPDRSTPNPERRNVAPHDATEAKLLATWTKILGTHPIGTADDFFDLGGDSLSAVELIAALETEFAIELPPGFLVHAPTVEKLARYIATERDKKYRRDGYLIQLQRGVARTPVFFVPGGIGGDSEFFVYTRLARHAGTRYPFYGFRARSAEGTESSQSSVEQIAADYITAMRSVQPHGPYYLIGECAGGIVAYEMAQQLHARGEHLALLILMDTPRPDSSLEVRRRLTRLGRTHPVAIAITAVLEQLRQRTMWGKVRYVAAKSGKMVRRLSLTDVRSMADTSIDRNIVHVQRSYSRAIYAYRPKRYPGRLTMIVHTEQDHSDKRPTLGWEDYAMQEIELHSVPGTHLTYIRDHVETAAARVRECIQKADAELQRPAPAVAAATAGNLRV